MSASPSYPDDQEADSFAVGNYEKSARALAASHIKDEFLAKVSTELRTPLTLILAPLESLLMGEHGELSEEQGALLKTVHNNSVKLLNMIAGLLDFTRIEAGTIEVKRQPLDVTELTRAVVADFQSVLDRRNLKIDFVTNEGSQPVVNVDRYIYEHITFNLLANAMKFGNTRGVVELRLEFLQSRVRLSIAHLDAKLPPNLFDDFVHIEGLTTRRFEGIGLSLAMLKEFAALLGGSAWVDEDGTCLAVEINAPRVSEPAVGGFDAAITCDMLPVFEDPVTTSFEDANAYKQNLPKVLIAEPNQELAAYVAKLLADMAQVRVAPDGEEALTQFHAWRPDLVLTAVLLSKIDGLALCRQIKSKSETSMTPVVLLTALTQRQTIIKGWEAGADEYLFKPFHPAELVTRVRSLLRGVQQRKRSQEQIERLNEALEKRVIELAAANRELKSLATKLEQARDQALESSRFKSAFVANMSHEIRTPINGVISMSDMLMRTSLTREQSDIAGIIRDSALSLLDIINDILDFSKIEAGKLDLEIVDFDLVSILEGTAELVADQARKKNISLMTHVSPSIPVALRGDPGRLRQILLNLLGNAIKFTEQGEVVVQASLDAHEDKRCWVRFSVADTGIGMPSDAVNRLFRPFTQADGSITRKYGGTGLGLSIAKLLVEVMGGRIGVRSGEGRGSTFWFSVPLEYSSVRLKESPKLDLVDTHLLLVAALPGTARIIREYTTSWGMRCESAASAIEAVGMMEAAARNRDPFDVALVELISWTEESFAIAQAVNESDLLNHTKLILCTAQDQYQMGERALQAGFSAYLIKPLKQSRFYDCLALVRNRALGGETTVEQPLQPRRLNTTAEMDLFQKRGMILVAEDNVVNQKVALLLLRELGFSAHVVSNGREAIEAVSRAPYSLVLMDCQMPELDGLEATSAIRRAETLTGRHIPIIALTAHAMQGDRERCIAAGMDDYMSKPVTADKLKTLILRWLGPDCNNEPLNSAPECRKISFGEQTLPERLTNRFLQEVSRQDEVKRVEEPEPVNVQMLEDSIGRDEAHEVLSVYYASLAQLADLIDTAFANHDGAKLRLLAHELKGASGSVGAHQMATVCKEIEYSAEKGDWSACAKLLAEVKVEYRKIDAFLAGYLGNGSTCR
jgi:signal transduction histidine kinase/HPt (histidine-containing phosphotransfer) domain-containing protein